MQRTHRQRRGFTLVELLVVISVIALLISILLPSLRNVRDQAKSVVCQSNLKQLGLSNTYYATDHNGRMPWILGTQNPDVTYTPGMELHLLYNRAPYHQYEQIFLFWNYLKELKTYVCPLAKSTGVAGRRDSAGNLLSPLGPKSVLGYTPGNGPNQTSYYVTLSASDRFLQAFQTRQFPMIIDPFSSDRQNENGDGVIEELYTEYWFNDWQEGATVAGRDIPAISGGIINRIPYPEYAVVMADAVDWNPRHKGGNNFMFLDTHVERKLAVNYFDPEGPNGSGSDESRDTDPFGNHPYWSWGLGKSIQGY